MKIGQLSFWSAQERAPSAPPTRTLSRDHTYDAAIVGGGLSGLWSAWALKERFRDLSVAVFEAESVGFGASGRNGGWLSAKPVGVRRVLVKGAGGRQAVIDMQHRLVQAIAEVVDILGSESIDARHVGWTQFARSPSEQRRLETYVADARDWGVGEASLRMLPRSEAYERLHLRDVVGAIHSPDNYCVDPVRMVTRLAETAMNAGVDIFTGAKVDNITPGLLTVGRHRIGARQIVVATEGFTAAQRRQRRGILPLNSSMLVTEPLTAEQWEAVGWSGSEGIAGSAHTYFYGQRTTDGRIAIGGRGRPYRFGSRTDREGEVDHATVASLMRLLTDLFDVKLVPAHAWCGVLGVTRDWSPYLDYDAGSGILRLGGYAGQGLTASYLAGLAAADLIAGRETFLSTSPWVRPAPHRWEPEPLRWIGANTLYRAYSLADRLEARSSSGHTSVIARVANKIAAR